MTLIKSNNIITIVFISCFSGAFLYALKKTNGNFFKSFMFALFCLGVKLGLIDLNFPLRLSECEPNQGQQYVSTSRVIPVYNPYVSIFDQPVSSKLYMSKSELVQLRFTDYSYSQELINELRAGNSRVNQAAWLLLTIWMMHHQSFGFQQINPVPQPPHIESAKSLLFGQPKSNQFSSRQSSLFDSGLQEFEHENENSYSSQIISEKEALDIIIGQYGTLENPQFDYIDESLGLMSPHQQLAVKVYHAHSYKVLPQLYGITKSQITAIQKYGLIGYVSRGGQLPSSDFIFAYQEHVKTFYSRNKATLNLNGAFQGERAIIVHNLKEGEVLIFRASNKQLWTPTQLSPNQMRRYLKSGCIGKQSSTIPPGTTPPPLPQTKL